MHKRLYWNVKYLQNHRSWCGLVMQGVVSTGTVGGATIIPSAEHLMFNIFFKKGDKRKKKRSASPLFLASRAWKARLQPPALVGKSKKPDFHFHRNTLASFVSLRTVSPIWLYYSFCSWLAFYGMLHSFTSVSTLYQRKQEVKKGIKAVLLAPSFSTAEPHLINCAV